MTWALVLITAVSLAAPAEAPAASAADRSGGPAPRCARIDNFARVSDELFRAAQSPPECVDHLATLGVKTIIDLRKESEPTLLERDRALAAGLRYVHVPMAPFARPSNEQVAKVLGIIRDGRNQPVLVHCKRGGDRTGTIVAVYRIGHDGWSRKSALAEARRFGLGWWQSHMKGFIKSFTPEIADPSVSWCKILP